MIPKTKTMNPIKITWTGGYILYDLPKIIKSPKPIVLGQGTIV